MPLVSDFPQAKIIDSLSEATVKRFLGFCEHKKFAKKAVIFRGDEAADSLYFILKGTVTVSSVDENGVEVILAYLNQGDFIGEVGLFFKSLERTATVRARTECDVACISYAKLAGLFETELKEQHAEILTAIGYQLSKRLLKSSKRISILTSLDVKGRIARTLLDMCHEPEAMSHPEGTQIHISRQEIARIINCSRETVGRVLKQMAEDGMIEVHGMDIVVYHSR